jgi:cysteine synthase A
VPELTPRYQSGAASTEAARYIPQRMGRIPTNITDHVGRTPLVRLTRVLPQPGAEIYAKLESYNPGGSVKDRIAVAMLEAAEREGRIEPGRTTIVEATSGNTGIGLAFACAARGYDLILTLPQGMSRERERLLTLYGAQVVITESLGGMNEAVDAARELAARDDVWLPDQFSNPANPEAHRRTTGPELWEALEGRLDVFVAGVAVEPRSSPVLSGGRPGPHRIQGIGAGFVPAVLNREVIDEVIPVADDDAIAAAHLLAQREGVLAGISGGAATHAALLVAARPEFAGARIGVILPDSGERYVSLAWFAPEPAARVHVDGDGARRS